jgi:hypothetical protein
MIIIKSIQIVINRYHMKMNSIIMIIHIKIQDYHLINVLSQIYQINNDLLYIIYYYFIIVILFFLLLI